MQCKQYSAACLTVCLLTGFQKTHEADPDWNFFWANVGTVKMIFNPESGIRLNDMQLINHYPNHFELTRKDLMVKNVKRYQREALKEAALLGPPSGSGSAPPPPYLDIVPVTYLLPADYNIFVEEFKRNPNAMVSATRCFHIILSLFAFLTMPPVCL
jgi:tubulin polyglutamylase TTLL1